MSPLFAMPMFPQSADLHAPGWMAYAGFGFVVVVGGLVWALVRLRK